MYSTMITPTCKELASRVNNRIMGNLKFSGLEKGNP